MIQLKSLKLIKSVTGMLIPVKIIMFIGNYIK